MATLRKTAGAQTVLAAEFVFDISAADAMANTTQQASQPLGAAPNATTAFSAASGTVYDIYTLPYNAEVVGGGVEVITASNDTGTATITVGDSGSATRYLGSTSIKSTGYTALVPTGYQGAGEAVRITLANQNGNATLGKVRVTTLFVILGRVTENLKTT